MNRKTFIACIVAGLITSTSAIAGVGRAQHSEGCGYHKKGGGHHGSMIMKREFTADQIATLTKAKLIMRGNENLKLGTVTSTKNGYKVTIVTQDNSLVKEQQLAKNGMPLKKFKRLKQRIEARKTRLNTP